LYYCDYAPVVGQYRQFRMVVLYQNDIGIIGIDLPGPLQGKVKGLWRCGAVALEMPISAVMRPFVVLESISDARILRHRLYSMDRHVGMDTDIFCLSRTAPVQLQQQLSCQ
jgi:hypothetical protein